MLSMSSVPFLSPRLLGKNRTDTLSRAAVAILALAPVSQALGAILPVERLSVVSAESICISGAGVASAPITRNLTTTNLNPFDGTAMGGNFFAAQESWMTDNLISVESRAGGSTGCANSGRGAAESNFTFSFEVTQPTGYSINGEIENSGTIDNADTSIITLYGSNNLDAIYTLESNEIQPTLSNNQRGILAAGQYTLEVISQTNDYDVATTSASVTLAFASEPAPIPVPPAIYLMLSALFTIGWLQRGKISCFRRTQA